LTALRGGPSAGEGERGEEAHQSRLWKPMSGMTYWVQSVRTTMMITRFVIPNLKDSPVEYMLER